MTTLLNPRGPLVLVLCWLASSALGQEKDRPALVVPIDGERCAGMWSVLVRGDGKWLVISSREPGGQVARLARLWDLSAGKQVLSFERDTDWLQSAVVSHDGKWFVTVDGNMAHLFDLCTGKKVRTFKGHTNTVRPVVLSQDGKRLVTAGGDGTVRLWDVATGEQLRVFKGHNNIVNAVALSADNKTLASAGGTATRLWDIASGKQLRGIDGNGSGGLSVMLTPDGKWLVTGGCGTFRNLRMWELATDKQRVIEGAGPVWSLALSTDSKWLATGGGDPQLWELESGEAPPAFRDRVPNGTIHSVALSRKDTRMISTSEGGEVRVWDVARGKLLCRLSPFRDGTWVAFDSENRYDSPGGKDVEGVSWKVGERRLPLSYLRERNYDPGLLGKHLGWSKEPLRELTDGKDR
jgi:WD40 repeat protein